MRKTFKKSVIVIACVIMICGGWGNSLNAMMMSRRNVAGNSISVFDSELKTGLIHLWEFDGDANDQIGGLHLTQTGDVSYVNGKMKNCVLLDGGYLYNLSAGINLNINNWMVSFWFNSAKNGYSESNGMGGILFNYTGSMSTYGIGTQFLETTSRLYFYRGNGGVTSASGFNKNTWYHICLCNNLIYIDGVKTESAGINSVLRLYSVYVGRFFTASSNPEGRFLGSIEQIGIWNRILSDDEVLKLYNEGNGLPYL